MAEKLFDYENEEEISIAFPQFAAALGDPTSSVISIDALRGLVCVSSWKYVTVGQVKCVLNSILFFVVAVALELGENITDEELQEMIREADVLDYDGAISREEFFRVMKRENAVVSG